MTSSGQPSDYLARELVQRAADAFERRTHSTVEFEVREYLTEALLKNPAFLSGLTDDATKQQAVLDAAGKALAAARARVTEQLEQLAFAGSGADDKGRITINVDAFLGIKLPWPLSPA